MDSFPTLEVLQKLVGSTVNGKSFLDLVKNLSASQITINVTVLMMRRIHLISLFTPSIHGTWIQQLLWHSTTLLIGTACPISILKERTTHHSIRVLKPMFSSLRPMDNKRRALRHSCAFFQRNYLPDEQVNKTVATVEDLSDIWKPVAMDGVPPFVMNCVCIQV